jgi:hypothetical protein
VLENAPTDPAEVVERSRELLDEGPDDSPVSPRSGLKSPVSGDAWRAGDWLSGWAWDRDVEERILHVAVVRDGESVLVVPADVVDRSLEVVSGRGLHGYRIPVLPELLEGGTLHLQVWEDGSPVYRGALYVDRDAEEPVLRRPPDDERKPANRNAPAVELNPPPVRKRTWWGTR